MGLKMMKTFFLDRRYQSHLVPHITHLING
jgi:hypothetical protein